MPASLRRFQPVLESFEMLGTPKPSFYAVLYRIGSFVMETDATRVSGDGQSNVT